MLPARSFLFFTLLYLLEDGACQVEFHRRPDDDAAAGDRSTENTKRPDTSNTSEKVLSNKISYYFRYKRKAKESSLAALRNKLNEEKRKEKEEKEPIVEANFTTIAVPPPDTDDFKVVDNEQHYNVRTDLIHQILNKTARERANVQRVDCNFESECAWTWRKDIANGFFITSGAKLGTNETGPRTDANGKDGGDYLLLRPPARSVAMLTVRSPPLGAPTAPGCQLHVYVWQRRMQGAKLRVVASDSAPPLRNHTEWQLFETDGDDSRTWQKQQVLVGRVSKNFSLMIEVVLSEKLAEDAAISFDNIQLYQCYVKSDESCTPHQYKCKTTNDCVNSTSICDITEDCPLGDDEMQKCDMMPYGSRCTFEEDLCGWSNVEKKILNWSRHNGSTPTNFTGPNFDHTYMNSTGNYMYVNMLKEGSGFASAALLRSVVFNPPPRVHGNSSSRYYNSCAIRFYLHKTGKHKSAISLQVTELRPSETVNTEVLWSFMNDHGDQWVRQVNILPNVTHKYFLAFEAKKGFRYMSDIAIDDVSLSPECFGLNIPPEELDGYNYWNPRPILPPKETHADFKNKTYYKITPCGAKGRFGPTQTECQRAYNNTKINVKVLHEPGLTGFQKWNAPQDGFYTFILAGASGGRGSSDMGQSRGAMVRTVIELKRGQEIYMLIGQEGSNSCVKTLGSRGNSTCYNNKLPGKGNIRAFLTMDIYDSGGGGGGGTFLFMRNRTKEKVPLVVAAGGGGLGILVIDNGRQHGQAINYSVPHVTGSMYGSNSAGAGGGWSKAAGIIFDPVHKQMVGGELTAGGIGGKACYNSTDGRGDGGFGGGGGGCKNGGGGGGYAGGNAINTTNGEGGYSFLNPLRAVADLSEAISGHNQGPGYVLIIPATEGCNCDFRCAALDAEMSTVACICPRNWKLDSDMQTCTRKLDSWQESVSGLGSDPFYPTWLVLILIITILCLTVGFGAMCFLLYNRYQQRASGILRDKFMTGPDFQLNRIRIASDSMMTEYNPNYEFGGIVYTLKDLKDIPRDQLRLVKALGQGAFGEVYQGFYRQRPIDTVEMPVAVKTLPEMSTSQAEMDFLMEALIMSKFNHPNIVHFIGVCFDKHPRFIVLELLAGGDLKNFLRESRPKPERGSSLSMKDLVLIAVDVAKGCRYLEENRFIHRDIAARNCLLTTKGPGRVVKIADFGMSRDVYRSDYYRKGGKAMLPIKWMPPEAFLDGIFTSKTDVWSFGVLLWEILKMGYMPYTGCTNREVMDLVVQGGRLEQPENCPGPIYGIMTQCWHPKPEMRPTFATILERLGYCTQDPDVMNAALPVFQRAPSNERDTTVMRPHNSDETCLQVIPTPSDYLIPNHATPQTPDPIESTSSVEKLLPDNSDNWETSFIMPNSRSTQPLLMESSKQDADQEVPSVDKLLTIDNSSQKVSPVSPQSNHNNNAVKLETSLKSGVSLDAGALAKQAMTPNQKKKYANVNPGEAAIGNGVLQNGGAGFSLNRKSDAEIINC